MKKDNPVRDKSYAFALRIIKLNKYLITKKEFIMSRQVLKSGTSIGANVTEALRGESKPDFVHKLSIALKEACETEYWLKLLNEGNYIEDLHFQSIVKDCVEIIKLLKSIIISTKRKINS